MHGIPGTPTSTDTVAGYPHTVYASGGRTLVETYTITGMGNGPAWHLGESWHLSS